MKDESTNSNIKESKENSQKHFFKKIETPTNKQIQTNKEKNKKTMKHIRITNGNNKTIENSKIEKTKNIIIDNQTNGKIEKNKQHKQEQYKEKANAKQTQKIDIRIL